MNSDVLVLDMNWQPVGFCTWQNAVKLWFEDRAIVVKEDSNGKVLRSPSFEMGMPRVIRVKNAWVRRRKHSVPCTRRNLLLRDNAECQYCGKQVTTENYTMEHVLPVSRGGKTEWSNVVVACAPCNKEKDNRTPEQAGMRLRKQPVTPKVTDPLYNFKLHITKMRPEWQEWSSWLYAEKASWLYWNVELDK